MPHTLFNIRMSALTGTTSPSQTGGSLTMPHDQERTRDFIRFSDFEINRLPWWKRGVRRVERVFVMNR